MNPDLVLSELKDRVLRLTLNNPEKRNPLSAAMVSALRRHLRAASLNHDVKVIIITGNGPAFCAGADLDALRNMQQADFDDNLADSKHLSGLFSEIYEHPKVTISRINGHALAGGCGLAALCDFSYAISGAKLGYTEVRIGFIPALVSAFLVRKIGEGKARELLLSGRLITAERAAEIGLINYAVDDTEELDEKVNELAEELCRLNSSQAMAATKDLLARLSELPLSDALKAAAEANARARESNDCRVGINSFLNKEKMVW
ncbi:MAG: enoyl-CoA hydratase-related protein [Bacteroidota bacterium]